MFQKKEGYDPTGAGGCLRGSPLGENVAFGLNMLIAKELAYQFISAAKKFEELKNFSYYADEEKFKKLISSDPMCQRMHIRFQFSPDNGFRLEAIEKFSSCISPYVVIYSSKNDKRSLDTIESLATNSLYLFFLRKNKSEEEKIKIKREIGEQLTDLLNFAKKVRRDILYPEFAEIEKKTIEMEKKIKEKEKEEQELRSFIIKEISGPMVYDMKHLLRSLKKEGEESREKLLKIKEVIDKIMKQEEKDEENFEEDFSGKSKVNLSDLLTDSMEEIRSIAKIYCNSIGRRANWWCLKKNLEAKEGELEYLRKLTKGIIEAVPNHIEEAMIYLENNFPKDKQEALMARSILEDVIFITQRSESWFRVFRMAIEKTIIALEQTKGFFKSKTIAKVRQCLYELKEKYSRENCWRMLTWSEVVNGYEKRKERRLISKISEIINSNEFLKSPGCIQPSEPWPQK